MGNELRRGNTSRALELLEEMKQRNFAPTRTLVRYLLRDSLFEYSTKSKEAIDAALLLSRALAGESTEASENAASDFDIAMADALAVYGSAGKIPEMQQLFDQHIPQPGMYEIARLIEGYMLAGELHAAHKIYDRLLLPLILREAAPDSYEGCRLAATVALSVRAKVTKDHREFLATWNAIKAIPTFQIRTLPVSYKPFPP